jgi:hypothetical protein
LVQFTLRITVDCNNKIFSVNSVRWVQFDI